jgi:hypothetical protein
MDPESILILFLISAAEDTAECKPCQSVPALEYRQFEFSMDLFGDQEFVRILDGAVLEICDVRTRKLAVHAIIVGSLDSST